MHDPAKLRRLPIRRRTVLAEDGSSSSDRAVFCPSREASVPINTCSRCPRLRTLDDRVAGGSVTCTPLVPHGARNGRMDPAEAAARVAVGEVMTRDFFAVRPEVELETVARLFTDGNAGCVAVVDGRGGIVGIVSKTDLLQERMDRELEVVPLPPRELGSGFHVERTDTTTARDVMRRGVYCLPEDARLSHAIGVMATERIAHLPIVDMTGALVGILDGDNVVTWLARQIGYTGVGAPEESQS